MLNPSILGGLGVDIVVISRIATLLRDHPSAAARIFSDAENELASTLPAFRRDEFYAGRFAVKEAFLKAIGLDVYVDLRNIECLRFDTGAPYLNLRGGAAEHSSGYSAKVSISHDGGLAVAVVQLLGEVPPPLRGLNPS